jgi:hypothetical protein
VIDNFAPQPYPLEASDDGETWSLVLGWTRNQAGEIVPLTHTGEVRYRLAETRPVAPRPTASPSARVEPRRERGA